MPPPPPLPPSELSRRLADRLPSPSVLTSLALIMAHTQGKGGGVELVLPRGGEGPHRPLALSRAQPS
jgi:hypothetical protein